MTKSKQAIIIGAGPAGLTAAYELLNKTDIQPVIFEATPEIGGISKTYNYNGNRMDMGGHRFFSKSETVMDWWLRILPLQGSPSKDDKILGRVKRYSEEANAPDPENNDQVMLIRERLSRILYLRSFFDYPIALNLTTIKRLGLLRIVKSGFSYLKARIFPIKPEKSLEDFMINRFGHELYATFFRDYTHKVWGVPPAAIKPDWGAQRIKGLSVSKVLLNAFSSMFNFKKKSADLSEQQHKETSLIEQFLYPKYGPGHLWEHVAKQITAKGGQIFLRHKVVGLEVTEDKIGQVMVLDLEKNKLINFKADFVISSMPVKDLINSFTNEVPPEVQQVANGLVYRDFITVGLLLKKLRIKNQTNKAALNNLIPDLWIYIQESDVKLGRLQIFNNWSPYLVKDWENTVWVGLEYFANEGGELWQMSEEDMINFAVKELVQIGIVEAADVLDSCSVKVPKAYPAYFGTYDSFTTIRRYTDNLANLFLIGRNGMHKYNNMDHSMLTAMKTVENIRSGYTGKDNIWDINTEKEYHEEK